MIFLDQSLSCYDVIQILIENDQEQAILWNSEKQNFEKIFNFDTIFDIIFQILKQQV